MKIAAKVHGVEMSQYLVSLPLGVENQSPPPSDFIAEARRLFSMGWAPTHEAEEADARPTNPLLVDKSRGTQRALS